MKRLKTAPNGISIRVIHVIALICVVAIVSLLVVTTRQSSSVFSTLSAETDNYIVRQKAAHDLMEASDYLTENVQRFTLDGDPKYMNQYFEEAEFSQRRENALQSMRDNNADKDLTDMLESALNDSKTLMLTEYLAMKLVIEAQGITKYPDVLNRTDLKSDSSLGKMDYELMSAEEKMDTARELVMGNDYYVQKDKIRTKLKNALEEMDDDMAATHRVTSAAKMKELTVTRILIIVLIVILLVLLALVALLCTIPMTAAYRCRQNNEPLPVVGSVEFRALSKSYNEMYDKLQPPASDDGDGE